MSGGYGQNVPPASAGLLCPSLGIAKEINSGTNVRLEGAGPLGSSLPLNSSSVSEQPQWPEKAVPNQGQGGPCPGAPRAFVKQARHWSCMLGRPPGSCWGLAVGGP